MGEHGIRRLAGVPNSVMPKGVEHLIEAWHGGRNDRVPNSVMPKGVEHYASMRAGCMACSCVPNSVMPKGVEHYAEMRESVLGRRGAEFSDAERR